MSWFGPWTPSAWDGPWFGASAGVIENPTGPPVIYCVLVADLSHMLVVAPLPQVVIVSGAATVNVEACRE